MFFPLNFCQESMRIKHNHFKEQYTRVKFSNPELSLSSAHHLLTIYDKGQVTPEDRDLKHRATGSQCAHSCSPTWTPRHERHGGGREERLGG